MSDLRKEVERLVALFEKRSTNAYFNTKRCGHNVRPDVFTIHSEAWAKAAKELRRALNKAEAGDE